MKISLNWINDYVNLSGIPVEDIIHQLTMCGLEVEGVVNEKENLKGFVVGFVKEKKKHPNADKLSVCTVSTGKEDLQIVCGAPNVAEGQKVVLAQIGAVVPNGGFAITKAKLRGVESFGMLCSERELELSDNHSGIMVLDSSIQEGTPVSDALGLNDVILEIAITPNRPDALSHFGVARDLAAIFNLDVKYPGIKLNEIDEDINQAASVEIEDTKNCPRYCAKVVKDVEIKESPEWLKTRITKIGLRPINNIVDVTNYIMYELGQPLHAFDLDKLAGNKIIVKSTEAEEPFTTLDSKERKLLPGTLMICDAEKRVAVAGIMGGENSEVTPSTKNILIESAYFNPSSIRKASKYLGLSTDASYRFERGIDPNGSLYAAERAAQLIAELSGGKVLKGNIDVYPGKINEPEVTLRFARTTKILGFEIPAEKQKRILEKLGFKVLAETPENLKISVPTYRPDVEREIDLIEEIARINGYDEIPAEVKISINLSRQKDDTAFASTLRDAAVALGFFEMMNNSLHGEKYASMWGNKIPVRNPQSIDMAYLRTSLLPGALETIARNINRGEKNLKLFEIGNIFNQIVDAEIKTFADFTEEQKLVLLISGKETGKEWYTGEKSFDFYSLKGYIKSFLEKIALDNVLKDSYYLPGNTFFDVNTAKLYRDQEVGFGGRIKKEVLKQFDIQQEVYAFEFDLKKLKSIELPKKEYSEPLKFPKVIRDFAFIFDKSVQYEEVRSLILKTSSGLLKSVNLFDLFENEQLGGDKKSMAFTLEFYSGDRTLTEEEVEKDFNGLISSVSKNFNAKLRG